MEYVRITLKFLRNFGCFIVCFMTGNKINTLRSMIQGMSIR